MTNLNNENEFRTDLLNNLSRQLQKQLDENNLLIGEEVRILKDCSVLPDFSKKGEGKIIKDEKEILRPPERIFSLNLGFTACDIVIYKNNFLIKPKEIKFVSLRKRDFLIPIIIIETKFKKVNSHELIVYSHKCMEIKDKFPYVMYNLVIFDSNKKEITLSRQGKNFNNIFIFNKKGSKFHTLDCLIHEIIKHLSKLQEQGIINRACI